MLAGQDDGRIPAPAPRGVPIQRDRVAAGPPMQDVEASSSPLALLELIAGSWTTQALHVAARLGIADHLAHGPRSTAELADALGAHAGSLHRLLRALTALGVIAEPERGVFALTPLGAHLRADAPASVRAWALFWGGSLWPIWATLLHSVRSGTSPRALVTRNEGFDSLAQQPEAVRVFNDAMVEMTRLIALPVVQASDCAGVRCLVDVGGGRGELLAAFLKAHAGMRGVLFDLPQALAGADAHLAAAGVADRCEAMPGSFFEAVPAGGDAYLLKSVLHDWNDERAGQILARCRQAMDGRGRLLVVERVLPERMTGSAEHRLLAASDLNMMVVLSGRERDEAAFRALFESAGFALTRIAPAALSFCVIEGVCA